MYDVYPSLTKETKYSHWISSWSSPSKQL